MRPSRVRVTDYRPPSAGGSSPLERRHGATRGGSLPAPAATPAPSPRPAQKPARALNTTSLDRSWKRTQELAEEHDKAILGHEWETLIEMRLHLRRIPHTDQRDPAQRWTAARKAAVDRRLIALGIL